MKDTVKTITQVKQEFYEKGLTFQQWAKENGYDRTYVSMVLNGRIKVTHGRDSKLR